ncbi:MAG: hypothetical protein ACW964_11455 [Candidatus Hodarchaeales archaeon]
MNDTELEKLFRKLFDSYFQSNTQSQGNTLCPTSLLAPTESFKNFVDQYIKEDKFQERRLICVYCNERITDDKFVLMSHPDHPNDLGHILYFHSKGKCNPRVKLIKTARERWLFNRAIARDKQNVLQRF